MSYFSFDVCDCMCHRVEGMHHVVACCYTCPVCKLGIKKHAFESHIEVCKDDQEKLQKAHQETTQ